MDPKIEARYALVANLMSRADPMPPEQIIAIVDPLIAFIFQSDTTPVPFKVIK